MSAALSNLIDIVTNTDCQWLDTRYDADASPTDIAEQVHAEIRAEVLAEAADMVDAMADPRCTCGGCDSCAARGFASQLRSKAGKDVRGGIQPSADESTQPAHAPAIPGTCARARGTYDWVNGTTPKREAPCRPYPELRCVTSCRDTERAEEDTEPAPFVPRTERSYWVTIADALNAANTAGMPVGIDLDGTLTDRNAWSVIWNRQDEKWEVAGYDDDIDGLYADVPDDRCPACGCIDPGCTTCTSGNCHKDDPDEWVRCSSPHCPNCERYEKATERGWVNGHMDSWHCPAHAARAAEGEVPHA